MRPVALTWTATQPARGRILLLHGVMSSVGTWHRIGAELASRGWDCLAVDLPGHGSAPRVRGSLDLDTLVGDVLTQLAAPADIVIGHSLGGIVALALAGRVCDGVRALVLEDPPGLRGERTSTRSGVASGQEPRMERRRRRAIDRPSCRRPGQRGRRRNRWTAELEPARDGRCRRRARRGAVAASSSRGRERAAVVPADGFNELGDRRQPALRRVAMQPAATVDLDEPIFAQQAPDIRPIATDERRAAIGEREHALHLASGRQARVRQVLSPIRLSNRPVDWTTASRAGSASREEEAGKLPNPALVRQWAGVR